MIFFMVLFCKIDFMEIKLYLFQIPKIGVLRFSSNDTDFYFYDKGQY